jgi:hypothetical protein
VDSVIVYWTPEVGYRVEVLLTDGDVLGGSDRMFVSEALVEVERTCNWNDIHLHAKPVARSAV